MLPAASTKDDANVPLALRTALDLLERGFWPVVLYPVGITIQTDDGPKVTTGKEPIGISWGKVRPTEERLRTMFTRWPQANLGIKLGCDAGIVDIENDGGPDWEDKLTEVMGGEVLETMGWFARRGSHKLVQFDERLKRYGKTIIKIGKLEFRIGELKPGDRQLQSAIPPSRWVDGELCGVRTWNEFETVAKLPDAFFRYLDSLPEFQPAKPKPRDIVPIRPEHGDIEARAWAYLEKVPDAVEGEHGHDTLYRVACILVEGFSLSYEQAMPLFRDWNATRAVPPESEKQLEHKLRDAIKNAERTGYLLGGKEEPKHARNGKPAKNGKAVKRDEDDDGDIYLNVPDWPAQIGEAAFRGFAGRLIDIVDPHTESDRVAILVQLLAGFGSLIGRAAHWSVEASKHYGNLFVCLVGNSAKARKGTSWDMVRGLLQSVDNDWAINRVQGGLTSGEGMIWAVRDEITKLEAKKVKGTVTGYQVVKTDEGVTDKRLLALETELGGTLKVLTREGNNLSALIRQAWDTGTLRTLTKNSPARATGAHISIVGHITIEEARKHLTQLDAANGFANRFMWMCVRRSKSLPFGGSVPEAALEPLRMNLQYVADMAREEVHIRRDAGAEAYWAELYPTLTEDVPGMIGALLARAEPMVMRVAMLYALLDGKRQVSRTHLESALAVWEYADRSARYIFGESLGDHDADELLEKLKSHPEGLTQTQIYSDVYGRNKSKKDIARILSALRLSKKAYSKVERPDGCSRPVTRWFATGPYAFNAFTQDQTGQTAQDHTPQGDKGDD